MLPPFPVSGNTDFHPAGPWEDDSRLENLRWRKSGNLFRNFSILPATPFYRRKAAVHFLRQISACFSWRTAQIWRSPAPEFFNAP